jgi:hypothetical protein
MICEKEKQAEDTDLSVKKKTETYKAKDNRGTFKEYPIPAKNRRGTRYRNAKRVYDPITKRYRLVELKGQQYYD